MTRALAKSARSAVRAPTYFTSQYAETKAATFAARILAVYALESIVNKHSPPDLKVVGG